MKVIFDKTYKYAPDGNTVIVLHPGEHDIDERFRKKAEAGGYVKKEKAKKNAPLNKSK